MHPVTRYASEMWRNFDQPKKRKKKMPDIQAMRDQAKRIRNTAERADKNADRLKEFEKAKEIEREADRLEGKTQPESSLDPVKFIAHKTSISESAQFELQRYFDELKVRKWK